MYSHTKTLYPLLTDTHTHSNTCSPSLSLNYTLSLPSSPPPSLPPSLHPSLSLPPSFPLSPSLLHSLLTGSYPDSLSYEICGYKASYLDVVSVCLTDAGVCTAKALTGKTCPNAVNIYMFDTVSQIYILSYPPHCQLLCQRKISEF